MRGSDERMGELFSYAVMRRRSMRLANLKRITPQVISVQLDHVDSI
jgi:hypothetical protein